MRKEETLLRVYEHFSGEYSVYMLTLKYKQYQGWIQGWGAPGARPPKIGKNMICWRKIVIFHTKYPNKFRVSLRSAQFF